MIYLLIDCRKYHKVTAYRFQQTYDLLKHYHKLIKVKCLPVLLYGLEACPLTKSDLQSLDFLNNRFLMKLFTTKNSEIVKYCQEYFGVALASVLWAKRVSKFQSSFKCFCLLSNCVVLILFVLFTLLPCLFGD